MKQACKFPGTVVFLLLLFLIGALPAGSVQAADVLDVEAVVCRDVVDLKPIGPDASFPSSVGKLFCFSRIVGAKTPTTISHIWYYGNTERFRISLPVNSVSWRTYSMKHIQPYETGAWHVEIMDASDNKLEVINFQILKP